MYACRYNAAEKTVSLDKLIYIGESVNVHDRIQGHEKWPAWRRHLSHGQELCINFAAVSGERERAEAALIFHHKPPENTEFVNQFPYATTTVHTSGRNALLSPVFTVQLTARSAFAYR